MKIKRVQCSEAPMELLCIADPSERRVMEYLIDSDCYVAEENDSAVGVCVLREIRDFVYELMNIAVATDKQAKGIGTELLQFAVSEVKERGGKRIELGTGTFGYQLAFYQKAGFRVYRVERDFFLNNYGAPIFENGIQLKDMLRLAIDL